MKEYILAVMTPELRNRSKSTNNLRRSPCYGNWHLARYNIKTYSEYLHKTIH